MCRRTDSLHSENTCAGSKLTESSFMTDGLFKIFSTHFSPPWQWPYAVGCFNGCWFTMLFKRHESHTTFHLRISFTLGVHTLGSLAIFCPTESRQDSQNCLVLIDINTRQFCLYVNIYDEMHRFCENNIERKNNCFFLDDFKIWSCCVFCFFFVKKFWSIKEPH